MFDRRGCQRFLAEACDQHWIVADQVRQNDFDGVLSLEKDVTSLKDDSHPTLSESSFQLVTSVQNGIAKQRGQGCVAVLGTVIYVVGETAPTGWTFFH